MQVEIGKMLFSKKDDEKEFVCAAGVLEVGMNGKRSTPNNQMSRERDASARGAARISNVLVVLRRLLSTKDASSGSKLLMLTAPDTDGAKAYIEIHSDQNTPIALVCDGSRISSTSDQLSVIDVTSALVATALSSGAPFFEEFQQLFAQVKTELEVNGALSDEDVLFKLCDSFYYTWKNTFGLECYIEADLIPESAKQAVRTGRFVENDLLEGLYDPKDFQIVTLPDKTEAAKPVENSTFDDVKSGRYRLPYVWDQSVIANIPALEQLDKFVPDSNFDNLLRLIHAELSDVIARLDEGAYGEEAIGDNYVNAILVGKPGTGKTTLAKALGAALGLPVSMVALEKDTDENTFSGKVIVDEDGFKFVETPFLQAIQTGGIILLEEFNLCAPGMLMGSIGQAIEKPFIIYKNGHEKIQRHPLCVVIATMNSGTEGSAEPSQAFTSRLPDTFTIDDPDEDIFKATLAIRGYSKKDVNSVYKAYTRILSVLDSPKYNASDIALSITRRHCFAALRQMQRLHCPLKQAIKNTMIGAIAIKDMALAKVIEQDVVSLL